MERMRLQRQACGIRHIQRYHSHQHWRERHCMQDSYNKLKSLLKLLCAPIRNNCFFYIATFCLFSISILFIEYGRCSRMRAGLEVFFDLYLLCVFVSLFPEKIRKYIKYFIFSLLFIIGIIDMICYKTMGIAMSPNILQTWILNYTKQKECHLQLKLHKRLVIMVESYRYREIIMKFFL